MKKVILFGAGDTGKKALEFLGRDRVAYFVDSARQGFVEGIEIINIQKLTEIYPDYHIMIASENYYMEIEKLLLSIGITIYSIYDDKAMWSLPTKVNTEHRTAIFYDELIEIFKNNNDATKPYYLLIEENLMINLLLELFREKQVDIKGVILKNEARRDISCKVIKMDEALERNEIEYIVSDLEICDEFLLKRWIETREKYWNLKYNLCYEKEFANKSLERYKDIHKNDRCFIIGTGPSLKMEDLEKLHMNNEICFGTNKIYLAFEKTKWRPDYYVVNDNKIIEFYAETIRKLPIKNKFIADYYCEYWDGTNENDQRVHFVCSEYIPFLPEFSDDISICVHEGNTVTYAAMQIAAYMGFKEIYLLGVDFSFTGDSHDEKNHFIKGYVAPNEVINDFKYEHILNAYRKAKIYSEENGFKIYNATRGGNLEVFQRVDFDDIMKKE